MTKFTKIPGWLKYGILIFPILIISFLILSLITSINPLSWMIIPAIIFEEVFESCCYPFSNNYIANLAFLIVFWFAIGSLLGMAIEKIKKHCLINIL